MTAPVQPEPAAYSDIAPAPARRGVRLPAWLAILIVVLVAGGLLYLAIGMLKPAPKVDLSQYESNDTGRRAFANRPPRGPNGGGPGRQAPAAPQPDGIELEPNGNGTAHIATLSVKFLVVGSNASAKPNLIATPIGGAGIAIEDRQAINARGNALNQNDLRKQAGITDDQLKKLRTFAAERVDPIGPGDRQQLIDTWAKYRAADAAGRPNEQQVLIANLQALSNGYAAARRTSAHAFATQIRTVLNADQIAKLTAKR